MLFESTKSFYLITQEKYASVTLQKLYLKCTKPFQNNYVAQNYA